MTENVSGLRTYQSRAVTECPLLAQSRHRFSSVNISFWR